MGENDTVREEFEVNNNNYLEQFSVYSIAVIRSFVGNSKIL